MINKETLIGYQQEINKLHSKNEEIKKLITIKINKFNNIFASILSIMGKIERNIIDSIQNNKDLNYIKSSWCNKYNTKFKISRLSYKEDGVLIKYYFCEDLFEGDYYNHYYISFIPYSYFNMNIDELESNHKIWANRRISNIIRNKKIVKLQEKIKDDELKHKNKYELYLKLKEEFENEK